MDNKMFGRIKWYKKNKGYGYIVGADNSTYYFESVSCVNPNEDFCENQEVKFIPNFLGTEYAKEVEKVVNGNE